MFYFISPASINTPCSYNHGENIGMMYFYGLLVLVAVPAVCMCIQLLPHNSASAGVQTWLSRLAQLFLVAGFIYFSMEVDKRIGSGFSDEASINLNLLLLLTVLQFLSLPVQARLVFLIVAVTIKLWSFNIERESWDVTVHTVATLWSVRTFASIQGANAVDLTLSNLTAAGMRDGALSNMDSVTTNNNSNSSSNSNSTYDV
jgi:hypothetical protein